MGNEFFCHSGWNSNPVCGQTVGQSVGRSSSGSLEHLPPFFRLPGLTCTHLFLFFNGGPLISVKMLWKLADNVKYEDDCEVSVGKARTGKKKFCRLIKDGVKVGAFGSFKVEFLLRIYESLERKKVKLNRKRAWKASLDGNFKKHY